MILDDGGDATLLMHLGKQAEKDQSVLANPGSEEERICLPPSRPSWRWTHFGTAARAHKSSV